MDLTWTTSGWDPNQTKHPAFVYNTGRPVHAVQISRVAGQVDPPRFSKEKHVQVLTSGEEWDGWLGTVRLPAHDSLT